MASYFNELELDVSSHYYYHYTNGENAAKIWKSGEVKPTVEMLEECTGVYLTTLKPFPHNTKRMSINRSIHK